MPSPVYQYAAEVVRWVDGDTVEIRAALGFHVTCTVRVRLRSLTTGLDVPERHTALGDTALGRVVALAPPGTPCTLHSFKLDRYGRTLGAVVLDTTREGLDVGAQLITEGLALPWDGKGPHPTA